MSTALTALSLLLLACFTLVGIGVQAYGVILGFRKAWFLGLIALFSPAFAVIVGAAKLFGKDVLR